MRTYRLKTGEDKNSLGFTHCRVIFYFNNYMRGCLRLIIEGGCTMVYDSVKLFVCVELRSALTGKQGFKFLNNAKHLYASPTFRYNSV